MIDKLFHLRAQIYYTNSKSYNAGCEDVYLVAKDIDDAGRIATLHFRDYYKKRQEHKRAAHVVFCNEMVGFIQEPPIPLKRNVIFEKND